MQNVIFQRLSRTIRERASTVAQQACRELQAAGFQMALHADFHLPVRRKPRGIDDRTSHALWRQALPDGIEMSLPRAVASLAINPFRQPLREARV